MEFSQPGEIPIGAFGEFVADDRFAVAVDEIDAEEDAVGPGGDGVRGAVETGFGVANERHLLERQMLRFPADARAVRGERYRAVAVLPLRQRADELPAKFAGFIGIYDVQRQERPRRERLAECFKRPRPRRIEEAANRQRIEPDGPHRDRFGHAFE